MKPAQWGVAVFVLAVMVFVITFAMNFLGGPRGSHGGATGDPDLAHSVTFLTPKVAPFRPNPLECEANVPNHCDFWFVNDNDKDVLVGGLKLGCSSCSSVELYLLPPASKVYHEQLAALAEDSTPLALPENLGLVPPYQTTDNSGKPLTALGLLEGLGLFTASGTAGIAPVVLRSHSEAGEVKVPPGRGGWMRLNWKVDKAGANSTIKATIWMNNRASGARVELEASPKHQDALRVRPSLDVGAVTDEQLAGSLTYFIDVWSSTRDKLQFEAKPTNVRAGGPAADPFAVGAPVPMTPAELAALEHANNPPGKEFDQSNLGFGGRVRCGYKVPVKLSALSPDKKVPFDVGQFRRGVTLSGPDVGIEPKTVVVSGRVRGLIEVGTEEEGSIDFRSFDSRDGATGVLRLSSDVPGVELTFDKNKTPVWLEAKLEGPKSAGGTRRTWRLTATVKKNQASGTFPRSGEPLYEDSAIYLTAHSQDKDKPPRPIRIAVRGTANER